MLRELAIKNFAIIEELAFSLGPGLNIISGETGAGKSIILDALGLILGDRGSPDLIRTEAREAEIEALFEFSPWPRAFSARLEGSGYPAGEELLVRRSLPRSGKGRIFLNGNLASVALLQECSGFLVEIYGQGEHQLLLQPEYHLEFLDGFGSLGKPRCDFARAFGEFTETWKEIRKIREEEGAREKRLDLLDFQIRELQAADPREKEDEELNGLRVRLANAEKISTLSRSVLEGMHEGEGSASERITRALSSFRELAALDPDLRDSLARLESARAEILDLSRSLEKYQDRVESDPRKLEEVETRLALLEKLKRKYGGSLPEAREHLERSLAEREELSRRSEALPDLERKLTRIREDLAASARKLSAARREAGKKLRSGVRSEVRDLGMPEARFDFRWESAEPAPAEPSGFSFLTAQGIDRIEFLLSANPGEDLKPLRKVASGGELSRIMLALKKLRSTRGEENPTLIFDEIDAGIGGAVAEMVGQKLFEVSRSAQVICVTHLPQIASYADRHFQVKKLTAGGKTRARIQELSEAERLEELSRMLAGLEITDKGKAYARELLARRGKLT